MKQTADIQARTIAELAARCEGPDQFERFDRAVRATLTVPKAVVVKEETRQKRLRTKRREKKSSS